MAQVPPAQQQIDLEQTNQSEAACYNMRLAHEFNQMSLIFENIIGTLLEGIPMYLDCSLPVVLPPVNYYGFK